MGQFERTLIIVDEGAYVHYVEGCTAPIYSSDSLHSAVVEIIVKPTRPLPLHDDPELVEQRLQPRHQARRRLRERDDGVGRREPRLEADDEVPGDLAARRGRARRGALDRLRRQGQHQDAGGKAVHIAPNTTSVITSKSISKNGGRAGYRGLLEVAKGATGAKSKVVCDALILDEDSRSDTYPYIKIDEDEVDIGHEATVSKIGEEQLFYLMSRGLSEAEARAMIVAGFVEPITKELPLEYAVEMNR
jgi:Fe-S cluster assembly protein SufB